ncbi:hypothetical protein [Pseudomonas sp. A34-9]|uniref:hypothetical protein n=1 Tax=Pseudomonas sp. A34-9 TaxID=3034675 RepID=UPI00240E7432|nr:hypothetical protein [Pseudomonas sp. A34-9]
MVDELEQFQQDLLESVCQMKAGKAARLRQVPLSMAAEARAKVGVSQSALRLETFRVLRFCLKLSTVGNLWFTHHILA